MAKNYASMSEDALVESIQALDQQIAVLRDEKREAASALDAAIHASQAQAKWAEMSQEERVALKKVAGG